MVFQRINIRQIPWEVLKTAAFGLDFQHLPRDLANVNALKIIFDHYINMCNTVALIMINSSSALSSTYNVIEAQTVLD